MVIKLDSELLAELRLAALRAETKRSLLQFMYEKLELNVGTTLADMMSDSQLDEFDEFIDDECRDQNRPEALAWLKTNLPSYKQVVEEKFDELKDEVRVNAPAILASDRDSAPSLAESKSNRNLMGGAA